MLFPAKKTVFFGLFFIALELLMIYTLAYYDPRQTGALFTANISWLTYSIALLFYFLGDTTYALPCALACIIALLRYSKWDIAGAVCWLLWYYTVLQATYGINYRSPVPGGFIGQQCAHAGATYLDPLTFAGILWLMLFIILVLITHLQGVLTIARFMYAPKNRIERHYAAWSALGLEDLQALIK